VIKPDEIFLRYVALPATIRGLTVQDEEGKYNIYLNSRFTHESHTKTLQHELEHIEGNDFSKALHIKDIEK
jgi:hypothetical protein